MNPSNHNIWPSSAYQGISNCERPEVRSCCAAWRIPLPEKFPWLHWVYHGRQWSGRSSEWSMDQTQSSTSWKVQHTQRPWEHTSWPNTWWVETAPILMRHSRTCKKQQERRSCGFFTTNSWEECKSSSWQKDSMIGRDIWMRLQRCLVYLQQLGGHGQYAKFGQLYLQEMLRLQERYPQVSIIKSMQLRICYIVCVLPGSHSIHGASQASRGSDGGNDWWQAQ